MVKSPNSPGGELTIDSVETSVRKPKKIKNSSIESEMQPSHHDVKPLVTFEEKPFPEIKLYERLPVDLVQRNENLSLETVQIVEEESFDRNSPSPIGETLEIHETSRYVLYLFVRTCHHLTNPYLRSTSSSRDPSQLFSYTITNPTYIVSLA